MEDPLDPLSLSMLRPPSRRRDGGQDEAGEREFTILSLGMPAWDATREACWSTRCISMCQHHTEGVLLVEVRADRDRMTTRGGRDASCEYGRRRVSRGGRFCDILLNSVTYKRPCRRCSSSGPGGGNFDASLASSLTQLLVAYPSTQIIR